MGFTPDQVGAMSLWQFTTCAQGYAQSQAVEAEPEAPSDAEFEKFVETI